MHLRHKLLNFVYLWIFNFLFINMLFQLALGSVSGIRKLHQLLCSVVSCYHRLVLCVVYVS